MSDTRRYSPLSVVLHWGVAVLIFVMMTLGFMMAAAPTDAIEDYVQDIHISLGFFVFLIVVWRIGIRLVEGFPPANPDPKPIRLMAKVTHLAILVLLTVQVITGPMYLFTENECVDVFGWFAICLPLESLSSVHELMETIHVVTGLYILPVLIGLHLLGAIRHYFVHRN
ncbi:hypothetical protein HMF8227_02881 [Saliniradius amylolyticus]|uniref:Cytochrome b561 bacterial/Ni-hydrogenase domain-containing protein n=1 Tax=Saliniradius amylolyticus TaxID=2183582 RepID=A0A2S2E6U2_9ALTE|nr:cytochrome b/b6 domain-containing protein [Saliniradius amylolyticus]AWL13329.1 hypothetical protein HMF8227_02881 [Saliniradius amylolyticus]